MSKNLEVFPRPILLPKLMRMKIPTRILIFNLPLSSLYVCFLCFGFYTRTRENLIGDNLILHIFIHLRIHSKYPWQIALSYEDLIYARYSPLLFRVYYLSIKWDPPGQKPFLRDIPFVGSSCSIVYMDSSFWLWNRSESDRYLIYSL